MEERLQRVFRQSFGVDTLEEGMSIGEVDGWDSLGHVALMMVLQQEFGVKISPARATKLVSVRDIRDFLREHASG
jgi:acyl carrier protein